jgi:hypothetical protein
MSTTDNMDDFLSEEGCLIQFFASGDDVFGALTTIKYGCTLCNIKLPNALNA